MTAHGEDVPEDGRACTDVASSGAAAGDATTPKSTGPKSTGPKSTASESAADQDGTSRGDAEQSGSAGLDSSADRERARAIPEAAVARLAVYLRVLSGLVESVSTVSSEELARAAGVNSAKLRKDLSYIGSYGTRGVGYEVAVLIGQIERTLGLTRKHSVAVVGIGNLGHALANYGGFPSRGFPVGALFDLEPDLIDVPVGGIPVSHVDDIVRVCTEREVTIGAIATPAKGAQEVCDRLVAGGVTCILNFAPVVLRVPEEVEVRKVDLAVEMQILSFHVARRNQAVSGIAPAELVDRDANAPLNDENSDGMVVRP